MSRLHEQIRHHYRAVDERQDPIDLQELLDRVEAETTIDITPKRRPYRRLAGLGAVAMVLVLVGIVGMLTGPTASMPDEAAPTTVPVTPPTTSGSSGRLEETLIGIPDDVPMLAGTAEHMGGPSRTGVVNAQGPRRVDGYYWKFDTGDSIVVDPVAWGQNLYVVAGDGNLYALNQTVGDLAWPPVSLESGTLSSPALGTVDFGAEVKRPVVAVVDGDTVKVFRADSGVGLWSAPILVPTVSSPVFADGVLYVASSDGFVYAFDAASGQRLWVYPENPETGEGLGPTSADLTYADGFLYVGTEDGSIHVLEVSSRDGVHVCERSLHEPILNAPMVSDIAVYVVAGGRMIWTIPPGACDGSVQYRRPFYVAEDAVYQQPVVNGGIMYLPAFRFLNARGLSTAEGAQISGAYLWSPGDVGLRSSKSSITGAPVLAGDTLYYGDEEGLIYAVDATSGERLWTWATGSPVRVAPVVVDGAVFIASSDGVIYAVGEGTALGR